MVWANDTDAGIAEQQVVGGDQRGEDADLGRNVQRLGTGKQERRRRKRQDDEDEDERENAAARRIA
ncbi:hypothetical protein ACVIYH_006425 [Bradyrhizobium diazoefficiens]